MAEVPSDHSSFRLDALKLIELAPVLRRRRLPLPFPRLEGLTTGLLCSPLLSSRLSGPG
jgi:hypothetical protein